MCKRSVQLIDSPHGFCYDRDLDEVLEQPVFDFTYQHADVSDGADDTEDDSAEPIGSRHDTYVLERWRGRQRGKAATLRTYRDGSHGGSRHCVLRKLALRLFQPFPAVSGAS